MTSFTFPLAGVELGGTKSIAILYDQHAIIDRTVIPTTTPKHTLGALRRQLDIWHDTQAFRALGIASFGPLQLGRTDPYYGRILPTPKPGWSGADLGAQLASGLGCPWDIDTDVNGAALAEHHWGEGGECDNLCYITIGTGLGVGILINGQPVHGAMHPELGHLRVRRAQGDAFPGVCPFHGDCIEGLVAGPALAARFDCDPSTVAADDIRWTHVAADIAELIAAILLTLAPGRILLGGGVAAARPLLLPMIRERTVALLAGYISYFDAVSAEAVIQAPALGNDAGPLGAIALAMRALSDSERS